MDVLEESSPLYREVYRTLSEQLRRGDLHPGDRLPSERHLSERLGVSRDTIRRALRDLAAEGLVETAHGRGHFVSGSAAPDEPLNALLSMSELGRQNGPQASARVLERTIRPADFDEAEAFGIVPGSPLLHLSRLRLLDGLPVAIYRCRVPTAVAPGIEELDFADASLYGALERAGRAPARADYTVSAGMVAVGDAHLLDVAEGTAVLLAQTRAFDADERLLELARAVYRSDRHRFHASFSRPRSGGRPRFGG